MVNGCMFEAANIESQIDEVNKTRKRKIKTYKQYVEERHYTGPKIEELKKIISVHHLKHRSEGGETTIENCSDINRLAHDYMHTLPREDEEVINNMLREHKNNIDLVIGQIKNGRVQKSKKLNIELDTENYITIPLELNKIRKDKEDEERDCE